MSSYFVHFLQIAKRKTRAREEKAGRLEIIENHDLHDLCDLAATTRLAAATCCAVLNCAFA